MISSDSSAFPSVIHLQRLKQLDEAFGSTKSIEVDVSTLAHTLSCSPRNIAKLMKTLSSLGWVQWSSGRGRGNKSQLKLDRSFSDIFFQVLEAMCLAGRLNEAYRYAEQFNQTAIFKAKFPEWLGEETNKPHKSNNLVVLVPYQFPNCHPMWAFSATSVFFIESMYDTLVKFDKETGNVKPYLAHYFRREGLTFSFRIRPNVFFHNGERVTANHVVACFEERLVTPHRYSVFYRNIKQVESKGEWVIFTLLQNDPLFLNVMADIRSAVFLSDSKTRLSSPIGTGPYQLVSEHPDHWALKRNDNYFGFGGIIEFAEFWSTSSSATINHAHIRRRWVEENITDNDVESRDRHGCEIVQFYHHGNMLSINERAWLVTHMRQYAEQRDSESTPLANSMLPNHHDRGFYLFINELKKPSRPIHVLINSRTADIYMHPLCDYLEQQGITIHRHHATAETSLKKTTDGAAIDMRFGRSLFGDDLALEYYEWLMASRINTCALSAKEQKSFTHFIDKLMQENTSGDDFVSQLYRAEEWLIQNCLYVPLWRDKTVFQLANNLFGTETNNLGALSLSSLWVED